MITSERQKIKGLICGRRQTERELWARKRRAGWCQQEAMASASTLRKALVCLPSEMDHGLKFSGHKISTGFAFESWSTREACDLVDGVVVQSGHL
jgi:hypothetical protein